MEVTLWQKCLTRLEHELPEQQFNTWIRPLHAVENGNNLRLLAPNQFVLDWVRKHHFDTISQALHDVGLRDSDALQLDIGSHTKLAESPAAPASTPEPVTPVRPVAAEYKSNLNPDFTFETFVGGKSNQLARAASMQVGENPGGAYNPLLIYGDSGLGKTHLMHAVGNLIKQQRPDARVVYLHSERFVQDMVRALQHNAINEFKSFYRTCNVLLIDDIQFFAKKERSQEEFFHTFNALLEGQQQVVLTCDRYPKAVDGLEDRLKSRFAWGMSAAIEPAELETRVAILMSKAEQAGVDLPQDVAFFIAKRFQSNIRELEGALRRVMASARFTGQAISIDLTREALRDLLALQDKLVSIENIQKVVVDYYQIRMSDLSSARRSRTITRPRQVAMALSKELTTHSLPEIGDAFGGRDHTTVLHACRKVAELRENDLRIKDDYNNLLRTLTT